ncbi:MAG: hypothetical protein KME50_00935 [Nostoc desertorum CM1-VF14]|jgi:hypothetical protein|nr:hypothetical protein [Nostoc desertorum CM1-VF14]
MKLTISATPQGLVLVNRALQKLYGTQTALASNNILRGVLGRSTISKFFTGKKIKVDEFKRICIALKLESQWEEIAGLGTQDNGLDNNAHVCKN